MQGPHKLALGSSREFQGGVAWAGGGGGGTLFPVWDKQRNGSQILSRMRMAVDGRGPNPRQEAGNQSLVGTL